MSHTFHLSCPGNGTVTTCHSNQGLAAHVVKTCTGAIQLGCHIRLCFQASYQASLQVLLPICSRLGANSLQCVLIQRTMVSSSMGCCACSLVTVLCRETSESCYSSWEPWDSQSCSSWHRGEKAQYSSNHDGMSTLNNLKCGRC